MRQNPFRLRSISPVYLAPSIALLTLVALAAPSVAQLNTPISQNALRSAAGGDTSGPSLKETGDWLTTNLLHLSANFVVIRTPVADAGEKKSRKPVVPGVDNRQASITAASMTGCKLSVTELHASTTNGIITSDTTVFDVPLEQVQAVFLGVNERPSHKTDGLSEDFMPATTNVLHLGAQYPVIAKADNTTISQADKQTTSSDSAMVHQLQIETDDPLLAKRVENAFNHVIALCHQTLKPEPF